MDDSDQFLSDLAKQIEQFQQELEAANAELAPLSDEEAKINAAKYKLQQQYQEQMEKVQKELAAVKAKKLDLQGKASIAYQKKKSVEKKLKDEEAAKEKAAIEAAALAAEKNKYLALSERFDAETARAPWREWAKDHQIKAGHKITMDRYVILADPMGLGKTLSSIITADMVEKVTKEASTDHPFLGIEEEQYVPDKWVWTEKGVEAAYKHESPFDDESLFRLNFSDSSQTVYFNQEEAESEVLKFNGQPVMMGKQLGGYIARNTKNEWTDLGLIEKIEAHYKTIITNAIDHPVGRKVLYFCPSPLLRNVMEEWQKWAPHRNVTYIGNMTKAMRNFVLDTTLPKLNEYVIIVNYEAWRKDKALLDKLSACKFDTIIIDEAHNIKDTSSIAYKGVETIVNNCKPAYIIPMTGTPILNRPQEIFPLLHLVNPKEFMVEKDFLLKYCEQYVPEDSESGAPRWRFKPGGMDLLAKRISKNYMRRTKNQTGIKLPEKSVIYHELPVDPVNYPLQSKARKQMKEYATIIIDEKAGKALEATVMIALITRLRQIETWPAGIVQYQTVTDPVTKKKIKVRDPETGDFIEILRLDIEESQKIDYIIRKEGDDYEGLIPDVVEDERVVVFSQFKLPLHELKKRCEAAGLRAVILDGDTSNNLRDEIRHDFDRSITPNRADSKWDVLLANYKAAGVGLNLTNATQLITLDEEWNPGKREQAWDRIHRIGQTENVTINVVRTMDTIDTWMAGIIDEKQSMVEGFDNTMMKADDFKKFLEDD